MFKFSQYALLACVFFLLNTCDGSEIEVPMIPQDQEPHKATRVHRDLRKVGEYGDPKALRPVKILEGGKDSHCVNNDPLMRCFFGFFCCPCVGSFTLPCLVQNALCCNWCAAGQETVEDEVWGCYESYGVKKHSEWDSYEICAVRKGCDYGYYWGKQRLYHEYISIPMDENGWWIPRTTDQISNEISLRKSEILKKKCPHGVPLFVDCSEGEKLKETKCEVQVKKKDKKWHEPEYAYVSQTTVTRTYNTPLKLTHSEKRETHSVRTEVKAGYYEEIEIDVPCEEGKVAGKDRKSVV